MALDLKGKTAAITGAASGIGLATATSLIELGVTVVLIDKDQTALAKCCKSLGGNAIPLIVDLLAPQACETLLESILTKVDHLDIFHANAGLYVGGDLMDNDFDRIDLVLNLNINAVIKGVRSILPHMIARKTGDIIVTSSVAGHAAIGWEAVYSPSKWAVNSFVQILRRQCFKQGIRVGMVSPGPVISALLADWPKENLEKAKNNGSLIEPIEVAEAIVFMLTRQRNVTIRDMVVLPTNFDI